MVGFNPAQTTPLSATQYAIAGAVSGAITRAVCQPLDVLKIRFQLQIDPIVKSDVSKYWGIRQAANSIWHEEGWRAFWKGHVPAQGLSIAYGISQYASFEVFTRLVWEHMPEHLTREYRPLTHLVCGSLAGCTSTLAVQPMDVLRTRFVAQGEPKIYRSLGDACVSIWRQEGVVGFYRGLIPAMTQIGPQMGLQFGLYSLCTSIWDVTKSEDSVLPAAVPSLVCGSGSGLLAKLIIYPLDVIKKRLQVQGFEKARESFGTFHQYKGFTDCLVKLLAAEGARGLYKGLGPSLIKAAVVAGCNFCVYDQVVYTMSR
ncbi:mitochondrial thiamine pyrophosphate carrier-like [Haliotis rufescens]|uniref:mitochondrial thiamine pyrophosphate carrier-like n=1 Tax=Haliotis rufescens TaxID=6454 RepID=UPI00201F31F4|nr:mitochondrial thiamine pyrophosphate carrier-like [Haliotis rufescens]